MPVGESPLEVTRSVPYGHVAAVLGAIPARLESCRDSRPGGARSVSALALIAARILDPQSKLATAQGRATSPWLQELKTGMVSGNRWMKNDLYADMRYAEGRQPVIEQTLAKRHLHDAAWCSTI